MEVIKAFIKTRLRNCRSPCLCEKVNKGCNRTIPLEVFCRKVVLRNKLLFLLSQNSSPATLLKKRLVQVFPCKFCDISKNTFFYKIPPVAACDTKRDRPKEKCLESR